MSHVADPPAPETPFTPQENEWLLGEVRRAVVSFADPRTTPGRLWEQLPTVAHGLYEYLQAGHITEDQFWTYIREFAAAIAEAEVSEMFKATLAPPQEADRIGAFAHSIRRLTR